MIEMLPMNHPSTGIHSIGFDGDRRGNLHVQFKNEDGKLTSQGFYKDVPRAMFNAFLDDRKPGVFLNKQLKGRFEWEASVTDSRLSEEEEAELAFTIANPDLTLPDMLFIPAHVPNTVEAIKACIDAQRISAPVKQTLFE